MCRMTARKGDDDGEPDARESVDPFLSVANRGWQVCTMQSRFSDRWIYAFSMPWVRSSKCMPWCFLQLLNPICVLNAKYFIFENSQSSILLPFTVEMSLKKKEKKQNSCPLGLHHDVWVVWLPSNGHEKPNGIQCGTGTNVMQLQD